MNILILIITILVAGTLGGITNAIRTEKSNNEYWKSIIKGIVAAFLIPVFLEIIKSDIGRQLSTNLYDYLVFGGLCLIAAIFSDKFIDTIGDKILQKAGNAEKKAQESNEKVNTMIEKEAEPEKSRQNDMESRILNLNETKSTAQNQDAQKIINALKSTNYKFRILSGIAEETGLTENVVKKLLLDLQDKGLVKQIDTGKRIVWTLDE